MGKHFIRTHDEQSNANLTARIEETNRQVGQLSDQVGQLSSQVGQLGELFGHYASTQTEFIQTIIRTFEAQAEINRRTDEQINVLITVVERLAEGRS
jgi:hypothetical protein